MQTPRSAALNRSHTVDQNGRFAHNLTVPTNSSCAVNLSIADDMEFVTLQKAVEFTIKSKIACNCRPEYVRSLTGYLREFARGRETMPVREITASLIREYLENKAVRPVTKKGIVSRLGSLFSYCFKQEFIDRNPMQRLERIRVDRDEPKILTVPEVRIVMDLTQAHHMPLLAYVTLCLFCGLRPCEAMRMTWDKVSLDKARICVDASVSKGRRTRRVTELHRGAVEWLRIARAYSSTIRPTTWRLSQWHKAIRIALGWDRTFQDVLRHSSASYKLAFTGDAGKVATALGNSTSVLMAHYISIVTAEEALAFFSLRPTNSQQLELQI